jgi:hypothetical protein
MSFHLAIFKKDWADEFDVYGFKVLTDLELQYIESLRNNDTEVYFGFGSNESWDDVPVSELVGDLNISEITEQEYNSLVKQFMGTEFGIFPNFVEMLGDVGL